MDEITLAALVVSAIVGSLIRFKITTALDKEDFPLGTLLVNIASCFILAICLALATVYDAKREDTLIYFNLMLFELSTGVLSTYSSFAYQLAMMIKNGKGKEFIRYGSYTIAFSIVAFYLGWMLILN